MKEQGKSFTDFNSQKNSGLSSAQEVRYAREFKKAYKAEMSLKKQ